MIDRDTILKRIKKSVSESDPDATLILYGSYARGDYHEDSDIDLLILIDKDKVTHDDRVRISYPLYDIQFETGILISPKVFSRNSWLKPTLVTPFYENVDREGILL